MVTVDSNGPGPRGAAGGPALRPGDGDLRGRLEHDRHGRPDDVRVHGLLRDAARNASHCLAPMRSRFVPWRLGHRPPAR